MDKKISVAITVIVIISIFILGISSSAYAQKQQTEVSLSQEETISIAIKKAKELGYNPGEMNIIFDEGNKKLKDHLSRVGVSVYDEKTKEWKSESGTTPEKEYPLLAGRNYQAVYFSPKMSMKGGDLWVFVDNDTGEVITFIGGE